jgi:hypothetical protein
MTRTLKPLLLLVGCFACGVLSAAEEGFSSLEEQMTGKEFSEAGLDRLSQAELDALNGWIRRHSLGTLATPASVSGAASTAASGSVSTAAAAVEDSAEDRRGFKDFEGDRTPITSRIVGSFSGWDGQTVFELENGMIWAQSDKDKFYVKELENPVAVIEPGLFGSWKLHIEGHDSECRVERLE